MNSLITVSSQTIIKEILLFIVSVFVMSLCFALTFVIYTLLDTWKIIIPIIALSALIFCDYKIMNILARGMLTHMITVKIDKIRDHF